jgi:hypothetical protein
MNSAPPVPTPWFRRFGWIYRPVHLFGWIVTLAALAFVVQVFVAIDRQSHSVTDTLYRFYPYAAPTFLGLLWLASRTSAENGGAS